MKKLVVIVWAMLAVSCGDKSTIPNNPQTLVGTTWKTEFFEGIKYGILFFEEGKSHFQMENTTGDSVVYEDLFSYEYASDSGIGKFIDKESNDAITMRVYIKGSDMVRLFVDDTGVYVVNGDSRELASMEYLEKIKDFLLVIKNTDIYITEKQRNERMFVVTGNRLKSSGEVFYKQ